jgi:hypothetical protein
MGILYYEDYIPVLTNFRDIKMENKENILFEKIDETSIFFNENGDIVLKQISSLVLGEEEHYIIIPISYLDKLINKLQELRDEAKNG